MSLIASHTISGRPPGIPNEQRLPKRCSSRLEPSDTSADHTQHIEQQLPPPRLSARIDETPVAKGQVAG